ncbi:hypothetical protein RDI58_001082 [Solanum bulbocastanum]|uniref:Uncharacterized protein n=1 Tax=Solanum bulbocastanum TaxID=147425 RepID=A0AAN8U8V0_SOLBU
MFKEDGNTNSQYQQYQNKEITTSQLMKNGRLRRGKLIGQFKIPWTNQNLLRKHCSSNRLITQDQPNNEEGAENQNSKNKDTMETQINNKSTTDIMLGMRTLTLTISKNGSLAAWEPAGASEYLEKI